jgi:DNA uptake protein ComE-like DNA-binding protein
MQLPGIGDYYSNKILELRNKLGGFAYKEQLLEIWKFDADRLEKIRDYITVDERLIMQLNINKSDAKNLAKHPYVDYKTANSIVKMRALHGDYKSIKEIKKSKLIDEEKYNLLKPYLKIK